MGYVVFALKYRPKDFAEVVGQAHVVSSLRNAIATKRVHHAYLFSGPRGVGKTSLARILAKSLNCQKGPTPEPCGACASCLSITKGNSLDIIEIDGASNRGIDEIRTLRENVKLCSAGSRFKIYIIDEVHMLTQEAFNALLKTLEEPPPHVKFIFATTHPHKVLPTILSRCQKFQFNLLTLEEIVAKLKKIVAAENITIPENLIYTIARVAAGSIRDAESLLDQLVPVILERGSLEDVFSFLGIIDEESLNAALDCLVRKDVPAALSLVAKIARDGKDLGIFLSSLIEHLRNVLLAKVSPKTFKDLSDISPQSKQYLLALCPRLNTADILQIIDLFLDAKEIASRLNTVRIPLELALIKYCYQPGQGADSQQPAQGISQPPPSKKETGFAGNVSPQDFNIDDEDFDIDSPDSSSSVEAQAQASKSPQPKTNSSANPQELSALLEDEQEQEKEESELLEKDDLLLAPLRAKWGEVIRYIQKTRAALASHLSFGQPLFSRGNVVTVAFSHQDKFHKEIVENAKNQRFIENSVSRFLNKEIGVRFILQELEQDLADEPQSAQVNPSLQDTPEEEEGFLNKLMDTFDGKFHSESE